MALRNVNRFGLKSLPHCSFIPLRARTAISRPLQNFKILMGNNTNRCFQAVEFSGGNNSDDGESDSKATSTTTQSPQHESDWKIPQAVVKKLEMAVGSMTLDDFLVLESTLCQCYNHQPFNRTTLEWSLSLFRRLVQEAERNSKLLEEYEMVNWLQGNYPRSTKNLEVILSKWCQWWIQHKENEQQYNPENMLDLVENLRSGNPPLELTDKTYGIIVRAATGGKDPQYATAMADKLLDKLLEESMEYPSLRPSVRFLNAVLGAYVNNPQPDVPAKAEGILRLMKSLSSDGIVEITPDAATYVLIMKAWYRSTRSNAAERVEELLNEMKESTSVAPNTQAYRFAIHSWFYSDAKESNLRAYSLFVEVVKSFLSDGAEARDDIVIDVDLFSIVITKLAREGHYKEAEEIFQLLEEIRDKTGDQRFEPNPNLLQGMLVAYSKCGKAEQAESILQYLERLAESKQNFNLLPKRGYYVDVLMALTRNNFPDRAERLLLRMIGFHQKGAPNIMPDRLMFEFVISSWATSNRKNAAEQAERLLNIMHQLSKENKSNLTKPNERTYFEVMSAFSKSSEPSAPDRIEALLFRLLQQYENGDSTMKPSLRHFTKVITCMARSSSPEGLIRAQSTFDAAVDRFKAGDKSFQPDALLYMALMRAWAKNGDALAVETLFLDLFEVYSRSKLEKLRPSTKTFNIMLDAWYLSKHPEAPKKAKILFDSMLDFTADETLNVPPDGFSYSSLINIIAQSSMDDAAEQADKYLDIFKASPSFTKNNGNKKIFSCYMTTMAAWSRKGDAQAKERIGALLDELDELHRARKIPVPTAQEYTGFLKLVAKSSLASNSKLASKILEIPRRALKPGSGLLRRP